MLEPRLPSGVLAASLTPFHTDGFINHDVLVRHARRLLNHGCDGLLLFGMVGEGLSLTTEERIQTLDILLEAGLPADTMLVDTSAPALLDAVHLSRHATARGVGGVLVLPPCHARDVRPEGVFRTYDRLVQCVGETSLQLYLHHDPQQSVAPTSLDVLGRLMDAYPEQIAGVLDASGEWKYVDALCQTFPDRQIYTERDRFLLPLLQAGGAGVISGTANAIPLASCVMAAWRDGTDASSVQEALTEWSTALASYPPVPALKAMLADQSSSQQEAQCWGTVRPPLAPLPEDECAALGRMTDRLFDTFFSPVPV